MCRFFNLLFILFHIQVPLFPFFLMPLAIRESDKLIIFHYFCGRNYINEAKLTPFLKPITPPPPDICTYWNFFSIKWKNGTIVCKLYCSGTYVWAVEKMKLKVPLQTLSLQDLVSVGSPEQGYDPEQVRVLDCVPVPHVRLHVLHALQTDHTANKTNQKN